MRVGFQTLFTKRNEKKIISEQWRKKEKIKEERILSFYITEMNLKKMMFIICVNCARRRKRTISSIVECLCNCVMKRNKMGTYTNTDRLTKSHVDELRS